MVKTLRFQHRGHELNPWSGKIPYALWPKNLKNFLKKAKHCNLLPHWSVSLCILLMREKELGSEARLGLGGSAHLNYVPRRLSVMALNGPHCLPLHSTVWLKLCKPRVKPQHCNSLPGFFLLSPARLLCNHPFAWTGPGDCTPLHFQPFQSILRCVISAQSCCEDEETLSC